jgi:hypothetical protein
MPSAVRPGSAMGPARNAAQAARRPALRQRLPVRRDLPARGVGAAVALPYADADMMQLHLDEISRNVAEGAHAVLLHTNYAEPRSGYCVSASSGNRSIKPPISPEVRNSTASSIRNSAPILARPSSQECSGVASTPAARARSNSRMWKSSSKECTCVSREPPAASAQRPNPVCTEPTDRSTRLARVMPTLCWRYSGACRQSAALTRWCKTSPLDGSTRFSRAVRR